LVSILEKSKLKMLMALILIQLVLSGSIHITQAQNDNLGCQVEIVGGSSNMHPGEYVYLTSNLTGERAQNYTWTVEGPIIKEYDDNVYNSTYLTAFLNIDPPTYMSPVDFKQSYLSFYWQPNNTDPTRKVSLKVQTENNVVCEDSKEFNIVKNNDNINLQAEDFFVEKNHPVGLTPDVRITTRVLQQHQQWHNDHRSFDQSYSKKGSIFFDFHRNYIGHFDAWRNLFGYPRIILWDPSTLPEVGVEIDHTNRSTDPYETLALSSWFKYQPGAEGPENRTISFVSSFLGQNQLPPGHPLANSGLQIQFYDPLPPSHRLAFLNGHTFPMCEEMDYPQGSSGYPLAQNSLNDFEPDQNLLGCALTNPYHDDRHGEIGGDTGDMSSIAHSPRDPIFWRFHKFVDKVSEQRFFSPSADIALTRETDIALNDTYAPQIISQNPHRVYDRLTSLPTISENEKGLFGIAGVPALSAQFNEPVTGVKPSDFTVNGSPATQVRGTGLGPYVFIGFKSPEIGPINVTLYSGNITDMAGNRFQGFSWNYTLFDANIDRDRDGLKDGIEVNVMRSSPNDPDDDKDGIIDGIEATTKCLNPIVNDAEDMHMVTISDIIDNTNMTNTSNLDYDRDNITNVEEIQNKTDPCSIESPLITTNLTNNITSKGTSSQDLIGNISSSSESRNVVDNNIIDDTIPFTFIMKKTGGIGGITSQLQYDSFTKTAISVINGTTSTKQITTEDEMVAKRILNDSGFFDSGSFYPPSPNSADYFEYTLIATLDNKLQAVYWTDVSEDVPNGVENLPFILSYLLSTGVF
jgi:hypothetical protein